MKDKERQEDRREVRKSGDRRRRTDEQPDRAVKKGIIHMIAGGPTDGDSHRERKRTYRGEKVVDEVAEVQLQASSATLRFGAEDVQGLVVPRNALVITAEVASYDVQRVLIDTGSSADIIFLKCLQQMKLDVKIEPVHTALYGFSGSQVHPIGKVSLTVVLGRLSLRNVKMVCFLVVDASSAYIIILGRPSLNSFQAVVSTYCMKVKFPVGNEVREVTEDQLQSRRRYEVTLKTAEAQNKRKKDNLPECSHREKK
ncbi:retrotransposon protein [Striga asiatica]|uniref:Retrotransposon protein n=1 Tax=Striga asiatica TaxID=4170 RepID=A0A5A7PLN7_STRAF|nr:retrotransposon protein [Striga asiatica]